MSVCLDCGGELNEDFECGFCEVTGRLLLKQRQPYWTGFEGTLAKRTSWGGWALLSESPVDPDWSLQHISFMMNSAITEGMGNHVNGVWQ